MTRDHRGWRREAMLHLRVFGAAPVMERVAESVAALAAGSGGDHAASASVIEKAAS